MSIGEEARDRLFLPGHLLPPENCRLENRCVPPVRGVTLTSRVARNRLGLWFKVSLQSVLNAVARLVFRLSRYDHVLDALANLHWLRLPQRVDFKVAVMAFRVLHDLGPPYLNDLVRVADLPGRRRLRSSSSHQLLVPPFRLTTVGRCTFPVAASLLCNSLPSDIQSSPSVLVFRQHLKTFLFRQSFHNIFL